MLDAYASAAGVRRLLAPQAGVIGALGALLYQPALAGVTLSISAVPHGARLRVHSALDPKLARLSGPRANAFSPSLASEVPSGSMLMLDVTHLDKVAPRVLNAGRTGGIVGRLGPLLSRLGAALQSEGSTSRTSRTCSAARARWRSRQTRPRYRPRRARPR